MHKTIKSTGRRLAVLTLSAVALNPLLHAADVDTYPSKPITIIVPSVAGNVADVAIRLIAPELIRAWGQPVIIENKPGAGTITGTRLVAKAPKDGYTVLLTYTAHVQNPSLFSDVGYDPIKDFVPVSEVAASSTILAVSTDFPVRTLPELVSLVKANPGKYEYGSYGVGTTGHLMGELLKRQAGLQMLHVPYKGGTPLGVDMAGGHIKIGLIAVGTARPLLQSGKLIPVAIAGPERSALLPNVPTFLEHGYKDFEPEAWMGLLMPIGTPQARADAMSKEIARIVRLPAIAKGMHDLNLVPIGGTPQEFDTVLRSDLAKWTRVVRELGLTPQ